MHLHIFLLCIKKYLKRNGEFNLDTRPKSNCKVHRLTFSLLINFKTRYVIQRQRRNMNIRLLECSMFVYQSGNAISLDKKGILIDSFSIEMYKCAFIDNQYHVYICSIFYRFGISTPRPFTVLLKYPITLSNY